MKYLLLALLVGLIVVSGCISVINVTNFEECIAAGNPAMESYPRQCKHGDETFIEEIDEKVFCKPEQRGDVACTLDYSPVCGNVNVQCIKAPCPPVKETFSNGCAACSNSLVDYYVEGSCEETGN